MAPWWSCDPYQANHLGEVLPSLLASSQPGALKAWASGRTRPLGELGPEMGQHSHRSEGHRGSQGSMKPCLGQGPSRRLLDNSLEDEGVATGQDLACHSLEHKCPGPRDPQVLLSQGAAAGSHSFCSEWTISGATKGTLCVWPPPLLLRGALKPWEKRRRPCLICCPSVW